ncbi:MAG: putative adhesin [Planctomycetota bacterium]|jgi:hypothetical protein
MGVKDLKQKLFGQADFVCGGHGAVWPSHGRFTVPSGITIRFYVADGQSLPNTTGQKIDQVLAGGDAPGAVETVGSGQSCSDYHLFSSRAGGYLNLKMSSMANSRYITTTDKDVGVALSEICRLVRNRHPNAVIHWSACRSHEPDNMRVSHSKPKYSPALLALGAHP